MKPFVVDIESNIKNYGVGAVGDMRASPHHPDNKVVAFGELYFGLEGRKFTSTPYKRDGNWKGYHTPNVLEHAHRKPTLIVGQNISFDLLYMFKTWPVYMEECLKNIYIWDVQQVAYLLSGQTRMYPSLDQLCVEIGHPLKDEKIKAYWAAGIDTADIPSTELLEYLQHDLEATNAVFRYQYELVKDDEALMNLIRVKMDDILCSVQMEANGMHFDLEEAERIIRWNEGQIAAIQTMIGMEAMSVFPEGFQFNPNSSEHVSVYLFGGKVKMEEEVAVLDADGNSVVYKTGMRAGCIKTKKQTKEHYVKGMGLKPHGLPNDKGYYSTAEDVLKIYNHVPFVDSLISLRSLVKDTETYYRGYSGLVWPQDGCIHASFGHCGTRTGRMNHSKPNLGNVSRNET